MKTGYIAITGASSGIGEATAKKFIQNGYNVLVIARRAHLLDQFTGDNVIKASVDVTDREALDKALMAAEDKLDQLKQS